MYSCIQNIFSAAKTPSQLEKYLILLAFLSSVCLFFQFHTEILVQVEKTLYLTETHGLELWLPVVTVKALISLVL